MRFKDQVAIVTGASRGIGKAIAIGLAKEGCDVVIASKTAEPDPRLPGTIYDTAREVEDLGRRALPLKVDVRFDDQIRAMMAHTIEQLGRLDILINNAGALYLNSVEETPAKRFDLVMGVNARAAFLCCQAAIPHLRRSGGGHIVMMSPPVTLSPPVGKSAYVLSKYGMTMIAQALAEELRGERIAVNSLWPVTAVDTQAVRHFAFGGEASWRKTDIMVDATLTLLGRDPTVYSGRAYLDEEILREEGMADFSRYSCVPGTVPPPLASYFLG